jgi:uncharacterized protein
VLWIQTDMHATQMGQGELKQLTNNQMLACNPLTKEVRRFLTAPPNCEVTGVDFTPDMRSMFINIQHPGETRPRSSTVWIRRKDGGVIGA